MDTGRSAIADTDAGYRIQSPNSKQWNTTRSPYPGYEEGCQNSYDNRGLQYFPTSDQSAFNLSPVGNEISGDDHSLYQTPRSDQTYTYSPPSSHEWPTNSYQSNGYRSVGTAYGPYNNSNSVARSVPGLESAPNVHQQRPGKTSPTSQVSSADLAANYVHRMYNFSPTDPVDDITDASPSLSDLSMESHYGMSPPQPPVSHGTPIRSKTMNSSTSASSSSTSGGSGGGSSGGSGRHDAAGARSRGQARRGGNRDEFDGPHQFLPKPAPQVMSMMQYRELPHLPTNLLVWEQDSVLSQVNDRLSQCAFDFVARYQFPIPLTQDMRPVARAQDREWTEWVQLLKRLATKRRIPARVLYNGQIKQFVTILENSLEMRHAARHQSRPLKDDRNILQLISAGIQVAKILKDAPAMDFLDRLYVATDKQIQDRTAAGATPFRG